MHFAFYKMPEISERFGRNLISSTDFFSKFSNNKFYDERKQSCCNQQDRCGGQEHEIRNFWEIA